MRPASRFGPWRRHSALIDILGAARQYLGDDQIAEVDERHHGAADVGRHGPIEELVLESRAGQHNVERQQRRQVGERHDTRAPDKLRVVHSQCETGGLHLGREAFGGIRRERHVTSTSALSRGTP